MDDYYKNLPKKRMAAGALIFDKDGRLLVVKPSYKDFWSIPGGVVEDDESPLAGCRREVLEEVGLKLKKLDFVCLEYTCDEKRGESLQFIFTTRLQTLPKVKIDNKEIIEYKFVLEKEALRLIGGNLRRRLPKCLEAVRKGEVIYLENGK